MKSDSDSGIKSSRNEKKLLKSFILWVLREEEKRVSMQSEPAYLPHVWSQWLEKVRRQTPFELAVWEGWLEQESDGNTQRRK